MEPDRIRRHEEYGQHEGESASPGHSLEEARRMLGHERQRQAERQTQGSRQDEEERLVALKVPMLRFDQDCARYGAGQEWPRKSLQRVPGGPQDEGSERPHLRVTPARTRRGGEPDRRRRAVFWWSAACGKVPRSGERVMRRTKPSFWIRTVFVLLLAVSPAWAVDEATRAATRDLGTQGVQSYQDGDYATARQKLDEAFSIMRTAPLGLWSARALEKSGLLVQASERYLAAQRAPVDPEGDAQAQEDARTTAATERDALQARIPRLTVRITGAEPAEITLTVAGDEVPATLIGKSLPVNPGVVEVKARRGEEEVSGSAELAEGETKELVLTLTGSSAAAEACGRAGSGARAPPRSRRRVVACSSANGPLSWPQGSRWPVASC